MCLWFKTYFFYFQERLFLEDLVKTDKTLMFKDKNDFSEYILTHFATLWSKPGFDTYQTKVY